MLVVIAPSRMLTESDILRACLDWLLYQQVMCWRQNQAAVPLPNGGFRRFNGRKGLPDIIAILPPHGTFVAIEVKKPGGKMSKEQIAFHEELVKNGGVSICVTSLDELMRDWTSIVP